MEAVQHELDRLGFRAHASGLQPYTEDDLLGYEGMLGRRLPADFRWFAGTYGRGWFGAGETSITLADGEIVEYGKVGGDLRYRDLYVEPHYPPGLVDCASDLMGDVFFLRLADDDGVWFWSYYEAKDPWTGLVRAADGFTDLLARTRIGPGM